MIRDKTASASIVLRYDLYSLPTAQHKAGLAGLILMIESMKARHLAPLPKIRNRSPAGAEIEFTPDNLQAVFDDLFDASWAEVESRYKWPGKTPKRIEAKSSSDGKKGEDKRYIYDAVRPEGRFLQTYYPDGDGIWVKLWRDMLWSTLRGRPTTRGVYEERADRKPTSESANVWRLLARASAARAKGRALVEGIASSLLVGAQDVNAERVPFQGEPQDNLLLHFWPVASQVYAPRRFTIKGELEDAGYVLVIPEPSDLDTFVREAADLLRSLDTTVSGYRPRDALIDVPAEGGLEYLYHLTRQRIKQLAVAPCLAAVEIYHLEKRGNDIRTLAAERVLPDQRILRGYDALRGQCRNPIIKSVRIRNLLAGRPWYEGMASVFGQYPWAFFVAHTEKTPRRIPFFGDDVRRKLNAIEAELQTRKGDHPMNDEERDDLLAQRVYRLIQNYVHRKTESKSGMKYDDFKDHKDEKGRIQYPQGYREAQEKVCGDAFLAMRGRRDTDFVEYFAGTICSVPQWLPEEDYLAVSQALLADSEKVKTLSMLALSACSYLGKANATQKEGDDA